MGLIQKLSCWWEWGSIFEGGADYSSRKISLENKPYGGN